MKRREGEDFEAYKKRRMIDNIITKVKQIPKLVWNSRQRGTFVRGRDTLRNSRADQNRLDARKRKEEVRVNKWIEAKKRAAEKAKIPTKEHPDVEIWQQELPLEKNDA